MNPPDPIALPRLGAQALQAWSTEVLQACGVPTDDAALTARMLVRTSLRGIDTHGIARLPAYAEKLRSGEVNPRAQPHVEMRHGLLHCRGDGGLGQVVAASSAGGSAGNVGGFLLVINPALAAGQDAFDASVSAWLRTYLQAAGPEARYPAQRQAACEAQRLAQGIPVPPGLQVELRLPGERVGRPLPATRS